ncbi:MAG: hypothetical protein RLY87_1227 [Chloroflexota bacterium]
MFWAHSRQRITRSTTRTRIVSWDWVSQCGQVSVVVRTGIAYLRGDVHKIESVVRLVWGFGVGIVTAMIRIGTKHTTITRTGCEYLPAVRAGPALYSLIGGYFSSGLCRTTWAHHGGTSHLHLLTIAYMSHELCRTFHQESVSILCTKVYPTPISDFCASHGSMNGTPVSRKSRRLRVTNVRHAVAAIILSMAVSVRPTVRR